MYPFGKKYPKQTRPNTQAAVEYLVLGSEPACGEYMPGKHLSFHYQSRYLVKRRVMRNIRRLKRQQPR